MGIVQRLFTIQRAVAGSGFPFYQSRPGGPEAVHGAVPGGSRTRSPQQSESRSRLEPPSTARARSIARTLNVRVWPHTGYACISYRYLSSVHGRLSHDGPGHF